MWSPDVSDVFLSGLWIVLLWETSELQWVCHKKMLTPQLFWALSWSVTKRYQWFVVLSDASSINNDTHQIINKKGLWKCTQTLIWPKPIHRWQSQLEQMHSNILIPFLQRHCKWNPWCVILHQGSSLCIQLSCTMKRHNNLPGVLQGTESSFSLCGELPFRRTHFVLNQPMSLWHLLTQRKKLSFKWPLLGFKVRALAMSSAEQIDRAVQQEGKCVFKIHFNPLSSQPTPCCWFLINQWPVMVTVR